MIRIANNKFCNINFAAVINFFKLYYKAIFSPWLKTKKNTSLIDFISDLYIPVFVLMMDEQDNMFQDTDNYSSLENFTGNGSSSSSMIDSDMLCNFGGFQVNIT